MPAIRQSIEVATSVEDVRAAWPHFLEWVLVGSRRFSCSELACVDAVGSGAVQVQAAGDRTVVTFQLESGGDADLLSAEQLSHDIWHDLMLFKQYLEEHRLEPEVRERHADEMRRSHVGPRSYLPPDTDNFSGRRNAKF
jgi:hypothetical protein